MKLYDNIKSFLVFISCLSLMGIVITQASISNAHEGEANEEWSPHFGCGDMKTFIEANPRFGLQEVGIRFPERLFECLTDETQKWTINFPKRPEGSAEPWDHVDISWNPNGHIPEMVYDIPHFDFHFFLVSSEERQCYCSTECGRDDSAECNLLPDAEEVPVDYVAGPSAPGEGVHWIDLTSGEFNGQTFDQTFIYGSYDGDMIFYEPMITLDFLEGLASSDEPEAIYPIKQPDRVGIAGWYPRYYKISYSTHKKEFVISLIDFYYRD